MWPWAKKEGKLVGLPKHFQPSENEVTRSLIRILHPNETFFDQRICS